MRDGLALCLRSYYAKVGVSTGGHVQNLISNTGKHIDIYREDEKYKYITNILHNETRIAIKGRFRRLEMGRKGTWGRGEVGTPIEIGLVP